MCGHLRLLNIACAAKAKPRLVTLTKPSRDSPLAFTLLGGQEKGFCIFIDAVEPGSKAAEAGLKRGDQVTVMQTDIGEGLKRDVLFWFEFFLALTLCHSPQNNYFFLFKIKRMK